MPEVGVLGATGATGAELLRLLHRHPEAEVAWASSRGQAGRPVRRVHPNLGEIGLALSDPGDLPSLDVLFCATPHGTTSEQADRLSEAAGLVVDLSSDFRLDDPDAYEEVYGREHPAPDRLPAAAYGLPELADPRLGKADWIAGPGCLATAAQLALAPLVEADLLAEGPVVVDAKIGSSAAAGGGRWSSHAARTATVRPYAPGGHRHEAEIRAHLLGDESPLWMSAHAVDMPRGVLATVHVPTAAGARELQRSVQRAYREEPFVEIRSGRARPGGVPEPRFVAGTNRAQVAIVPREGENAAVALCAIDNLGKGAAGSAVQAMNRDRGMPEQLGLERQAGFP